jgi:hypothetical protein
MAPALFNLDSREFLKKLANDRELTQKTCFFYLDAHWGKDCPIRKEISLIASHWGKFIILIDDFQVPGDKGYGYDRYGSFIKLNLSYIRPVLQKYDLCSYFPTISSKDESGEKPRGCVILSKNDDHSTLLRQIPTLRYFDYQRV